ncbi:MAG TPA: hypothetical protein VE077_20905 [Candidatus Methylomirabilis sp.]|nr:hypothetical protein [Candidatus Methylomirabilis sp.]
MNASLGHSPTDNTHLQLPVLPQLWIGYGLGFVVVCTEFATDSSHSQMVVNGFVVPPLYQFLPMFVGLIYWLVCVYRYHVVMQRVPAWKHPISPAKAVGFHFIPIYFLYWVFKWPQEIAKFVNYKFQRPVMKPQMVGLTLCAAFVVRFFDPGLGLILLFVPTSYLAACLRRALELPPPGVGNAPASS